MSTLDRGGAADEPGNASASLRDLARSRLTQWLLALTVAATLLGVTLRFATLDTKLFTNDEATTSLRVAGHRLADYLSTFDGQVRTAGEIAATMQGGTVDTSPLRVATALAIEEPQHAPLYYVMERGWQNVFGDGVAARRALSALAGSMLIAATAWLAFELFGIRAALIAGTLVAVSPFHLIYAQQAREYALWSLLTAAASAFLVRALRADASRIWAAYAMAAVLGLYTDSLFLATLAAHAVAVPCSSRWRHRWPRLLTSITVALAAFSPWLWFLLDHARHGGINALGSNAYLQTPLPWKLFAAKWLFQISAVFFDSAYRWPVLSILMLPLIAIVVYALFRLMRDRIGGASLIVSLVAVPSLMLLLPDVVLHQSRSTAARYLSPEWIALEVAVSWLISSLLQSKGARLRGLGVTVLAVFAAAGTISCVLQASSESSWADGSIRAIGPISRIIDASEKAGKQPLVLWQAPFGAPGAPGAFDFSVVELADLVPADVRFQQFAWTMNVRPARASGDLYLLDPTVGLRQSLERRGYHLYRMYSAEHPEVGVKGAMNREAASVRKQSGFAELDSSLWRIDDGR